MTEQVVGTIFSVLEHEAQGTSVSSLFGARHGADPPGATTLIQQAETAAGPDLANQVLGSVPSLKSHLGL
ncbi:hypothetical protein [Mesorhizobium sp. AR10]|uniref:hypothetical protein n=1 Tax=Mesorhizobium sp. AR10 TaxID=2865839 RepID=UPI002160765D|nr:hypothetical protein [Mesorhizobium sp. AR10]